MDYREANITRMRRGVACLLFICCLVAVGLLVSGGPAAAAPQLDPSFSPVAQRDAALRLGLLDAVAFDPENLITDVNFAAVDSLSASAVQGFLAAQSGTLDSLRALDHGGVKGNASAIIAQAARAWGVSPKVILVTLQKEQGLLSATKPSAGALAWAMGGGSPSSFGDQVWYGAESLHNDGQGFYVGISKTCGDGTVQPTDEASYALYRYTPWIGVGGGGGNKLFWTLYWEYFGDPLAVDSVAPTTSASGTDTLWHDTAVTLIFSALDNPGGTGVAYTQYKLDSGSWTKANKLTIAAPASHAGDGLHTILYRSADEAGNLEAAHTCVVRIDTRRPKTVANWAASVKSGHSASLVYYVSDPRPGNPTATVTIRVRTSAGRLVRKLVERGAAVNKRLSASFVCRLAVGRYRFYVSACDAAGNRQSRIAGNRLTVR